MGGAIIANKTIIEGMRADFVVTGATLDPHVAFLIQRGLKTYTLRYERQCANAQRVAGLGCRPSSSALDCRAAPSRARGGAPS